MPKTVTDTFKIQRPLMTSDPEAQNLCLVYNKNRKIFFEQEFTPEQMKFVFGSNLKIYVSADYTKGTGLDLNSIQIVENQDW